jgi:hypothetical protein
MRTSLCLFVFAALDLAAFAGCSNGDSDTGKQCTEDSQCGKDVCANDQSCEPASDVELVHVTWTVSTQPASATTCAALPSLYLQFMDDQGDAFGFIPVPCPEGEFTATKLPTQYVYVQMLDSATMEQEFGSATINDGAAMMDLTPSP